jgi:hypothetical protein
MKEITKTLTRVKNELKNLINNKDFEDSFFSDLIGQYIQKYNTDLESPSFAKDLFDLYNKEMNYISEMYKKTEGKTSDFLYISVKNETDEIMRYVPLLNPNSANEKGLIYSSPYSFDNKKDNLPYQAGHITYNMLVNKLFYDIVD